jgi:uncharacterized protein (DUF2141 family)
MIDKDAIKVWINALRSGEYTQTTSVLKDENGNNELELKYEKY